MQKLDIPCIKTGEFAALCGTNKRTLFHYDEIGLFSPALTDEKGYRYYSENQCDVFFTITCLKELGMPLKKIKDYIDHRSPDSLERLLLTQQEKVEAELAQLRRIRTVIETKLSLVRQARDFQDVQCLSPVLLEEQAKKELLVLSSPLYTSDHDKIFSVLCSHIGLCSREHLNCGHPYGAMLPTPALQEGDYETYAYFFTKTSFSVDALPPDTQVHIKPAGTYAAVYLRGDYYRSEEACRRLLAFAGENGLSPGSFIYKEAVLDELSADEEHYLTRISLLCGHKERQ